MLRQTLAAEQAALEEQRREVLIVEQPSADIAGASLVSGSPNYSHLVIFNSPLQDLAVRQR